MSTEYKVNLTFTCLTHFDEDLEIKAFESVLMNKFNLPVEYLRRSDQFDINTYANPMINISWLSWRYRAMTAIALYNETHKPDA
ncbi:hypothetical protein [Acinetobacter variabilis]|uniref:Uncharacterized protein n=1 Tax=Acinetobacter variabilis TaxID=70346 RepID=N8WYT4_9GAMM|nr:hypothetical protein [Acinetobacter variabilis]ENV00438.1 hypothetical protein F969_00568 [Acinetobacter variabilis]